MSWQAYIDDNLLKSGAVTAAGIYDMQGNPWAYSAGFAAQVAEVAAVSGHMHTGDPSGLAGTGVRSSGQADPAPAAALLHACIRREIHHQKKIFSRRYVLNAKEH